MDTTPEVYFCDRLTQAASALGIDAAGLAARFADCNVSAPAAGRWLSGESEPNPRLQRMILAGLAAELVPAQA